MHGPINVKFVIMTSVYTDISISCR